MTDLKQLHDQAEISRTVIQWLENIYDPNFFDMPFHIYYIENGSTSRAYDVLANTIKDITCFSWYCFRKPYDFDDKLNLFGYEVEEWETFYVRPILNDESLLDLKFSDLLEYKLPTLSPSQLVNGKYYFSTLRNLFAGKEIGVDRLPMKYHLPIEENTDLIFDDDWCHEIGSCLYYMDGKNNDNVLIKKSCDILKNFYGIRDTKYDIFLKQLIFNLKEINFMPINDLILLVVYYIL